LIIERCEHLCERIAERKRLRQNEAQLKRFQQVRTLLTERAVQLAELVQIRRALRDAGIGSESVANEAIGLLGQVVGLRKRFTATPEALIEETEVQVVTLGDSLKSCAAALEGVLKVAWTGYAASRIPATNPAVLDALKPAFPARVLEIRQKSDRVAEAAGRLPRTSEAIQAFEADAASLNEAWAQLDGGEVPQAVLAFLRATAGEQGAPLSMLTADVRGWLIGKGIADSFFVRVASDSFRVPMR